MLKVRARSILIFAVASFAARMTLAQQSSPPPDRALELMRAAILQFADSDLQAAAHVRFPADNGAGTSSLEIKARRVGPRGLLSIKDVTDRPGQETYRMQLDYILEENGDVLNFQTKLDPALKQVDFTKPRPELRIVLYSQRLAGKQSVDRDSVYQALNDAGVIVWVVGYAPLLEYIEHAKQLAVTPEGDGARIVASGDQGRLSLLVSPTSGWLPRSFELVKEAEHRTIGGRVADVYENSVKSIAWTGELGPFASDADGRRSPVKISVRRQTNWKDKPAEIIETTIDVRKTAFASKLLPADLQTDIVAPPGHRVTVMDAVNLRYRWDGHAVVPGIPDLPRVPADLVEGNRQKSEGPSLSRNWLILLNLLAAIIIFGVVFWKKKNDREDVRNPISEHKHGQT